MPKKYRSIPITCCGLGVLLLAGCSDGPWHQLKRMNPYYQKEWAKDKELGPTFEERMAEARNLRSQIATMGPEEQAKWLEQLELLYANDPSPDLRREAVMSAGYIDNPRSTVLLQKASRDASEKVRLSVCESLGKRKDDESLAILMKLAEKDESSSVRVVAIEALGNYPEGEVKSLLAKTIQDRSPAIQYQTTQSLAKVTGKELGGDVALWRKYLNGDEVETQTESLAEKIGSFMTLQR